MNPTFELSADLTCSILRSGPDFLPQIILASASLQDEDHYDFDGEEFVPGFDSLSNKSDQLPPAEAAMFYEGPEAFWNRADYKQWEAEWSAYFIRKKERELELAAQGKEDWYLIIFTPYAGGAQVFSGSEQELLGVCNAGNASLHWYSQADFEAAQAAEEWSGDWEGEGYYGCVNGAADFKFHGDNILEAATAILAHDSSNNFSFSGDMQQAAAAMGSHRLIKAAVLEALS